MSAQEIEKSEPSGPRMENNTTLYKPQLQVEPEVVGACDQFLERNPLPWFPLGNTSPLQHSRKYSGTRGSR